jgi:hypothetical protein
LRVCDSSALVDYGIHDADDVTDLGKAGMKAKTWMQMLETFLDASGNVMQDAVTECNDELA